MAYKGINTYINEMKQKQIQLITESVNLGIPMGAIQLMMESCMKDVEINMNNVMYQEKETYERELENEFSEEGGGEQ